MVFSVDNWSDVDLYFFGWAGGNFTATTTNYLNLGGSDQMLSLFDSTGMGVAFNDDSPASGYPPNTPSLMLSLASGNYYLGISNWDSRPVDASDILIFTGSGSPGLVTPNLSAGALASWNGADGNSTYEQGRYTIAISPASVSVPEPSSIFFSLVGGAAVFQRLKEKKI